MSMYTGISSDTALSNESHPMSQVVIGTPDCIKALIARKLLTVHGLRVLLFDEAGIMLEQDAFQDDSVTIMEQIRGGNAQCKLLLLCAKFDECVKNFVSRALKEKHNVLFAKKEELTLKVFKVSWRTSIASSRVGNMQNACVLLTVGSTRDNIPAKKGDVYP